ncbi:MAG TPA: response regulator [Kofleriaceae bacterium]|nr:response regulator [Kofleriaceae bacterium]
MTTVVPDNKAGPKDGPTQQSLSLTGGHRRTLNASKLVLIVDDDPDLRDVTSFVLTGEGFGVETAQNGKEALQRLHAGTPPAVVLLDLMMPVMNGYQFLEEVTKVPSLQEIPIVVLTASSLMEVPQAVEVVHKPIDLKLLIKIVERHAHGTG